MPIGGALAIAGATVYAANSASDSAAAAQQQSAANASLSAQYADPYHDHRAYWGNQLDALMGKSSSGSSSPSQPLSFNDWRQSIGIGSGGAFDSNVHNDYNNYVNSFNAQQANGAGQPANTQSALAALQSSPGYQFRYNQGLQALNSSLAAKGLLNSGNRLAALTNYGQNFASGEYQNQFNRLASLSGASTANMGAAANNYSQNAQLGVGYGVAGNNAMSQGLGQLAGMYKNGDLGGSSSYGMPNYSQATSGDGLSSGTWGGMGGMGDYGFSATTL